MRRAVSIAQVTNRTSDVGRLPTGALDVSNSSVLAIAMASIVNAALDVFFRVPFALADGLQARPLSGIGEFDQPKKLFPSLGETVGIVFKAVICAGATILGVFQRKVGFSFSEFAPNFSPRTSPTITSNRRVLPPPAPAALMLGKLRPSAPGQLSHTRCAAGGDEIHAPFQLSGWRPCHPEEGLSHCAQSSFKVQPEARLHAASPAAA